MTSLKKYIRKIDESVLGFINNKKTKPLKRHAQIGESDEQVGLYDTDEDRWSRNAKRHFSKADLQNVLAEQQQEFDLDESVTYQGRQAVVRIPRGPNNTVGIIVEGRMRMVKRADIVKLDEGVLAGLHEIEPINRVMQLAGLSSKYDIAREAAIFEDIANNTIQSLIQSNNKYPNDPDSNKLYVLGSLLTMIGAELANTKSFKTVAALELVNSEAQIAKVVQTAGASMLQHVDEVHRTNTTSTQG